MLPASTAGGGLLSEDQSWGRLLVTLPLKHPSKATKKAGHIELEVRHYCCCCYTCRVAAAWLWLLLLPWRGWVSFFA